MNLLALAFASLPNPAASDPGLPPPPSARAGEPAALPAAEPGADPESIDTGRLFLQIFEQEAWGGAENPEEAEAPENPFWNGAPAEFSRAAHEISPSLPAEQRGALVISQASAPQAPVPQAPLPQTQVLAALPPPPSHLPDPAPQHHSRPPVIAPNRNPQTDGLTGEAELALASAPRAELPSAESKIFEAVISSAESKEPGMTAAAVKPGETPREGNAESPREDVARPTPPADPAPATDPAPVHDSRSVMTARTASPVPRTESLAPGMRAVPMEPANIEAAETRPIVREMSVRVETAPLESASLRFVERNGQVEVVVRASSPSLAASLQAEVPDLIRNLAQHDLRAQVSAGHDALALPERPAGPVTAIEETSRMARDEGRGGDPERSSGDRSSGERFEDSARRRNQRRFWEEEE